MNWSDASSRIGLFLLTTCLWLCVAGAVWADEKAVVHNDRPLHELIDEHIESGWTAKSVQPAKMASAAAFLRRITLDLTGIVPTSDDARAFLNDDSPNRRQRLIDQLLDSPEYSLHMARVMDVMLTERRIATIRSYDVSTTNWREYLAASFAENKPWDQLVREILSGDGTDTATGPA